MQEHHVKFEKYKMQDALIQEEEEGQRLDKNKAAAKAAADREKKQRKKVLPFYAEFSLYMHIVQVIVLKSYCCLHGQGCSTAHLCLHRALQALCTSALCTSAMHIGPMHIGPMHLGHAQ